MCQKNIIIIIIIILLAFLFFSTSAQPGQEQEGVLAPENFNEARLNRLQPPAKVMDAIGIMQGMAVAEIEAGRGRPPFR
jgi:hypothetical protein